jgi:hypothetical protein
LSPAFVGILLCLTLDVKDGSAVSFRNVWCLTARVATQKTALFIIFTVRQMLLRQLSQGVRHIYAALQIMRSACKFLFRNREGKRSVRRAVGRQADNIKMGTCTDNVGCEDADSIQLARGRLQ